ncbi:hypothetical protein PybrP1_011238 [[Pythium] brassicae (nom. inval.)]|nr:hypothetical protein PybrP1_011238 [[Pythium] brassicae (nom. inval.)]
MSFFTSNAYASFHQHLPPSMHGLHSDSRVASSPATPTVKRLSPQKLSTRADRLAVDNSSFVSTSSTVSTSSEFDSWSPLHVARSPRAGATATALGEDATAAASFKIYDQVDNEEWGEFINSSAYEDRMRESWIDCDTAAASAASRGSRRANTPAKARRESGNTRRASRAASGDDSVGGGFDEDEELIHAPPRQAFEAVLYDHGSVLTQFCGGDSGQPERRASSSSVLEAFATAVLSRFSSFKSDKQPQPLPAKAPWNARLFSGADEVHSNMFARGYDSYDITFERGPIGLALETDWYGRQAVVKGFKDDDGPAKQCGVIRIGDVLTAIDGESCLEMSFQETLAKLRQVSSCRHVLHFKSLEATGDLSVYNSDMGILQAKQFIHEHKERFYRPPCRTPTGELILGCVERLRGETVTAFNFHREDTGEFLLACSCVNECTGPFLFHTLQDSHQRDFKSLPQSEDSAVYLGQMVPNFLGTEFTVLDHQQKRRNELGLLVYSSNVLGRVPNFLKIVFPRQPPAIDDEGEDNNINDDGGRDRASSAWSSSSAGSGSTPLSRRSTMTGQNGSIAERYKNVRQQRRVSLVERLRTFSFDELESSLEYTGGGDETTWRDSDDHESRPRSMNLSSGTQRSASAQSLSATPYGLVEQTDYQCDLLTFETKKPAWNDELGAWTLNFHGRVKLASKKNFLLVPEQGSAHMEAEFPDERVFLRFGKVAKSRFSLDYQAPICPMLALAIVCTSFAHKIAVT